MGLEREDSEGFYRALILGSRNLGDWQGPKMLEWKNQEEAKDDGRIFDRQEG